MAPAGLVGVFVLGVAFLLLLPVQAGAQSELQLWLNPELGKQMGRADYRYTFYPERKVDHQDTTLLFNEHRVQAFAPVFQSSTDELTISGRVLYQDLVTHARLPETGEPFPRQLYDVNGGIGYRHKFDNSWIGGIAVTAGTATDEPFKSMDDVYVRALALLRVPQGERNAWILSVLYASDQEFFGVTGLPVPGLAFVWNYSEQFRAVVGVPFSSIEYKPFETLKLEAQYFPLWTIRTFATWEIFRPWRAYIGFDWDSDHWVRHDRGDKNDRFYYYEKRATVGTRFDLRYIGVEVFGGYAFDRFYFEGEGYKDRTENRVGVRPGPFVSGRLHLRF
jgi:hypothetical protein